MTPDDAISDRGALRRLLDDETNENIEAHGCDDVVLVRRDGSMSHGDSIAASDEELIARIRRIGAPGDGHRLDPELCLRPGDGTRLVALMAVTRRPTLSIRRHPTETGTSPVTGLGETL